VRAGHTVAALVRSPASAERLHARGIRPIVAELSNVGAWSRAAAGFDAYVHTALESSPRGPEIDRIAVDALLDFASRTAGAALVYTSGIWVLGATRSPAAEDAPLNPTPVSAWRAVNETRVLEAASASLRTVVVRPGIVYGGSRGIIADLLKEATNGLMRVIGPGDNHWPCVYLRDLADLYARLLSTAAAGIFHANDEADETVNDIVQAIAAHVPHTPDVRHVPLAEARAKLGSYADALALDQRVRSPRARAIGWTPTLGSVTRSVPRLLEEWRNARMHVA
jgi:nucleoside-diphosphate-sugar epimerase